jgi:hypothetical protein
MKNESVIIKDGIDALIEKLGPLDAERFISKIIKEDFDYTEWQKDLFKNKSLAELSQAAMQNYHTHGDA